MLFPISIFTCLFALIFSCQGAPFLTPADVPVAYGIDLVQGLPIQGGGETGAWYIEGDNVTPYGNLLLKQGDWRIGKIKSCHHLLEEGSKAAPYFFYEEGKTAVYDSPEQMTVYCYDLQHRLISREEHTYSMAHHLSQLYRRERLFWHQDRVIAHTIEDASGTIYYCENFTYDRRGCLTRAVIYGNLSGECLTHPVVQAHGQVIGGSCEHYGISYLYSDEKDPVLMAVIEDNGLKTCYRYDPVSRRRVGKWRQFPGGTLERCFYIYNQNGEIEQLLIDDGEGEEPEDRQGVTQRRVIDMGHKRREAPMLASLSPEEEKFLPDPIRRLENASSRKEVMVDQYGNETIYRYDPFGRCIETLSPLVLDQWDNPYSVRHRYAYDLFDRVIQIEDGRGAVIEVRYNVRGQPIHVTYPDGSFASYRYFLDGTRQYERRRDGSIWSCKRDDACRLAEISQWSPSGRLVSTLFYHYSGELLQAMTDGENFTITFIYDGSGQCTGALHDTADGQRRIDYEEDKEGTWRQTGEWFGWNDEEVITKREMGLHQREKRTLFFQEVEGHTIQRKSVPVSETMKKWIKSGETINALGQRVKCEELITAEGMRHIKRYDALGRVEYVVSDHPLGNRLSETHWRYDAQGNVVKEWRPVLTPQGEAYRVWSVDREYDLCQRLTSLVERGGLGWEKIMRWQYRSDGQLGVVIKPDGTSISYTYNQEGYIEAIEASDQSICDRYAYDALGRLKAASSDVSSVHQTRRYNSFHELIAEEQSPGIVMQYTYDRAGRRTGMTLPDGSAIVYRYKGIVLEAIERRDPHDTLLYQHGYLYDEKGKLSQHELIKGMGTVTCHYDSQERLIALESPWYTERAHQGMDARGRIQGLYKQSKDREERTTFSYQLDGQLAEEEGHHYVYDSLFNRLEEDSKKWEVNPLNQLIRTPFAFYRYDANGRLIEQYRLGGERFLYTYDAWDRLLSIEQVGKWIVSHRYDAFHRRVQTEVREYSDEREEWISHACQHFLYDGLDEVGTRNEEGGITTLRVLGIGREGACDEAIAVELEGHLFVPLHNLVGSLSALVDPIQQKIASTYRYSAYGIETSEGILEQECPWRAFGKRHEPYSGLIAFGKRDYDPHMGRWITPDPLLFYDSPNLYAFVKNDPINRWDRYGFSSRERIWDWMVSAFNSCRNYFRHSTDYAYESWKSELGISPAMEEACEKLGKSIVGEGLYLLLGCHDERTRIGTYGGENLHDKVRVTFINGILNTHRIMQESLELISQCHGGVRVHYVFRPTEGWSRDLARAMAIKGGQVVGFRSTHSHLLAQLWRELIEEMGGVEGGGTIIHYAHSLGGSETDRARTLLTPEEQRMIRVVTLGSATLVRNEGFQSVVNLVSVNDGVSSIFIEPFGTIRNFLDPHSNVQYHGKLFRSAIFPLDHCLNGITYAPLLCELGKRFLAEFQHVPHHTAYAL